MSQKLDRFRIDFLHGLMLDYGLWLNAFRASPGVWRTSTWNTGKKDHLSPSQPPPRRQNRKPLLTPTQPKSNRYTGSQIPCLNIERTLELVDAVIIPMPYENRAIVDCLYRKGMDYPTTQRHLEMSAKEVRKTRYSVFESVDCVV